jgi:hypothetical protein
MAWDISCLIHNIIITANKLVAIVHKHLVPLGYQDKFSFYVCQSACLPACLLLFRLKGKQNIYCQTH